jgi:hypothetical protein
MLNPAMDHSIVVFCPFISQKMKRRKRSLLEIIGTKEYLEIEFIGGNSVSQFFILVN